MNSRALAILVPVAILVGACSTSSAAPAWTDGPGGAAAALPSPIVVTSSSAVGSPGQVPDPTAAPSAPAPAAALTGEVAVTMTDAMAFTPDLISVKAGEEITFVVRNDGVIVHEFFVGTESEQAEHEQEMAMGGMSHGHDNAVSIKPGRTGSLTMTFAEVGTLIVGCHEPGHYAAGMRAILVVD